VVSSYASSGHRVNMSCCRVLNVACATLYLFAADFLQAFVRLFVCIRSVISVFFVYVCLILENVWLCILLCLCLWWGGRHPGYDGAELGGSSVFERAEEEEELSAAYRGIRRLGDQT